MRVVKTSPVLGKVAIYDRQVSVRPDEPLIYFLDRELPHMRGLEPETVRVIGQAKTFWPGTEVIATFKGRKRRPRKGA